MALAKPKEETEVSQDEDKEKLLIRQARGNLDMWFADPWWTLSELKNIITYNMTNDELVGQIWNKIMDPEQRFMIDTNERPILDERGRKIRMNVSEYINTKGFRGLLERWVRDDFRIQLREMDTITRLGAMTPYPTGSMKPNHWADLTPWFYLKNFNPSGFATIYGLPGSGKSDFACTLMQDALTLNEFRHRLPSTFIPFRIVTNIKIPNPPEGIVVTRKFSQMILTTLDNLLNHQSLTLCILDELSQFFPKKKAMSKKYQDMEQMIFLLRKPNGNLIGIVQNPVDIPTVVREFSETKFYKMDKNKLMIKHGGGRMIIKDVPPTTLPYDHRDPATFSVDIDMDDMHGFILEIEEDEGSVLPKMVEYLKSNKTFELTNFQINNYIKVSRLKKHPRPTYEEIGRDLGMSGSAVNQRCKKLGILDKQLDTMAIP